MARKRGYWKCIAVAVLAVVAFAVAGAALITQPKPQSGPSPAAAAPMFTASPDLVAPAKLKIASGTKTLFFGDSWTAGYAAEPSTQGFAYLTGEALGLDYQVNAEGSGTGYVNVGPSKAGTYLTRLKALPADPELQLLVLQGGLNDQGENLATLSKVVADTVAAAKAKFPKAQIVLVGPISPTGSVHSDFMTIDATLRGTAEAKSLHYISGHQERWITPENLASVIDAGKANHPSTAGHRYLGDRLVAALKSRAS